MMTADQNLTTLEDEAYRASYADGVIDIFAGVSLAWVGAAWIWLPDLAGFAGILPAVFVAPMLASRKQIVEPRIGFVRWKAPRREWERRNLAALVIAGVALLVLGIVAYVVADRSAADSDAWLLVMPGLLAWLLALAAAMVGFLTGMWRLLVYSVVFAGSGAAAVWAQANPGWPLLVTGIVIVGFGVIMLIDFLRHNPPLQAR